MRVIRKREDGFHDLETVFLRIGWKDELTFSLDPSTGSDRNTRISMSCSDPHLPVNEENLCIRAANALMDAPPSSRQGLDDLHISLHKQIPYGAGLGGGSSDAATVLTACSSLWKIESDLHQIGTQLGSDVPFFLGTGVAFGSGRGEVLAEMSFPPALRQTRLLVVVPEQRVSTADAFRHVTPNDDRLSDLKELVAKGTLQDWNGELVNDFEPSVFAQYPVVGDLKEHFLSSGASYASMSGSGSAVFGIFTSEAESQTARASLQSKWPSIAYWEGASDAAL